MAAFQLAPRNPDRLRGLVVMLITTQRRGRDLNNLEDQLRAELKRLLGSCFQHPLENDYLQVRDSIKILRLNYGTRRSAALPRKILGGDECFVNVVIELDEKIHYAYSYV